MRPIQRVVPRLFVVVVLALLGGMLVAPHGNAAVIGDDYPANLKKYARDAKVDPWRFYNRECTSFVAWRINNTLKFPFDDYWLVHWGNASNWKKAATSTAVKNAGVTVDGTPTVGSVAWWSAKSAGSSLGHVAWVAVVSSSSITIEEYNYARAGYYGTRVISRDSAKWPGAFIHFKPVAITNTAAPAISGTPKVGVALTASAGSWSVGSLSYTYQWYAGTAAIAGATARTFTPTATQLGQTLSVKVTAAKSGLKSVAKQSAVTKAVAAGSFKVTTPPSISGSAKVGVPLTANAGTWSPVGTYTYQWLADGTAIAGATGTSYTPSPDDYQKKISLRVTAARAGYTTAGSVSAATGPVDRGSFDNTVAPGIVGTPRVGASVTASRGTWTPAGNYHYQWRLGSTPIPGADSPAYTPSAADFGKQLSVTVSVTGKSMYTGRKTSTAVNVAPGVNTLAKAPSISGSVMAGHVLTVVPGSWRAKPTQRQYRWYADGVAIPGGTHNSLRLTQAQAGRKITVAEGVTATGYDRGRATSAATMPVLKGTVAFNRKPTFTGSTRLGRVVQVHAGATSPGRVTLTYQWYRGSTPIAGATSPTYRSVVADLGSPLTVRIGASAPLWAPASRRVTTGDAVRTKPTMQVSAVVTKHRLTLRLRLAAPAVAEPGGRVIVTEGRRRIARVLLAKGQSRITVPGLRTGVHHLTISYSGTPKVLPVTATRSVKVR